MAYFIVFSQPAQHTKPTYFLSRAESAPSMHERPTLGGGGSTPPTLSANPQASLNPQQAHQLQQYRQRLQQMHQLLIAGQQQLNELKKAPEQNKQKVTQSQKAVLAEKRDCNLTMCNVDNKIMWIRCKFHTKCMSVERSDSRHSIRAYSPDFLSCSSLRP